MPFLAALAAALAAAALAAALGAPVWLLAPAVAAAATGALALAGAARVPPDNAVPAAMPAREDAPPALAAEPPLAAAIEAFDEPVLLVAGQRVVRANAAARTALGAHIVGEDVRIAIRHPAAADALAGRGAEGGGDPRATIELAGVGAPDRRWALALLPLDATHRLVRLVDRTGTHAAERMRVDFVANASHELRTPLATLLGFIETLEDSNAGADAGTRARFLKIMFGEAKRMQRLVDDLISLSRIEADRYSQPQERVDLRAVLAEVRAAALGGLGSDAARIVTVIEDDAAAVTGDPAQLSQLLHNLIGNALKYGRPQTPVAVALRRAPGGMVRLSVADEGDGIAPEHLPRLTERFYRVDPGRSRTLGGTGLGLAIVKHIVERHRGRLDIASEVGRGTVVTVLLPPAPAPAPAAAVPAVTKA